MFKIKIKHRLTNHTTIPSSISLGCCFAELLYLLYNFFPPLSISKWPTRYAEVTNILLTYMTPKAFPPCFRVIDGIYAHQVDQRLHVADKYWLNLNRYSADMDVIASDKKIDVLCQLSQFNLVSLNLCLIEVFLQFCLPFDLQPQRTARIDGPCWATLSLRATYPPRATGWYLSPLEFHFLSSPHHQTRTSQ